MINFDELIELGYIEEDTIRFSNPSFDTAIIGADENRRLVYSYDLMVKEFMETNDCSDLEAMDFISYNTLRALPYLGSDAPIVVYNIDNL